PAGGVARDVPRPFLRALDPAAGAEEHGVAAADLDPRELLPRLEVGRIDRRSRFEERHVPQPWQIDDDAARHDAVLLTLNAVFDAAGSLRDLRLVEPV